MDAAKPYVAWKSLIMPVLESKAEEFRSLGYTETTNEDIWKCLQAKVWKHNSEKRLYEMVQDIFHLGSNIYMSYLTMESHQDYDFMSSIAALTGKDNADD